MLSDPFGAEHDLVARLRAAGCVFAEDEARLLLAAAPTGAEREALVRRRVDGEPLEQVLGWAEFCGLRVAVEPGVFVPRRRSEFLVECARDLLPSDRRSVVLDLCCGTGALGLALATGRDVEVHAADVDPVAVRCARRNLPSGASVHAGDLFAPLPEALRGRVDVLVANAPYVPSAELAFLPVEARAHEPAAALDGGADGLAVHRRIAAEAPAWLAPDGRLLIEVAETQRVAALEIMTCAGFDAGDGVSSQWGSVVVIGTRSG